MHYSARLMRITAAITKGKKLIDSSEKASKKANCPETASPSKPEVRILLPNIIMGTVNGNKIKSHPVKPNNRIKNGEKTSKGKRIQAHQTINLDVTIVIKLSERTHCSNNPSSKSA